LDSSLLPEPAARGEREQLRDIYNRYADDDRATPLLFSQKRFWSSQRLPTPYKLREAWPTDRLPLELLEGMANVWGVDLSDDSPFG
jgi:hypothetical protein